MRRSVGTGQLDRFLKNSVLEKLYSWGTCTHRFYPFPAHFRTFRIASGSRFLQGTVFIHINSPPPNSITTSCNRSAAIFESQNNTTRTKFASIKCLLIRICLTLFTSAKPTTLLLSRHIYRYRSPLRLKFIHCLSSTSAFLAVLIRINPATTRAHTHRIVRIKLTIRTWAIC